jgi:hypothetical protein
VTEHLSHFEVERTHAVALLESKVSVACTFTYDIERCTLALSNLTHMVDVLFLNEQTHTLLALVGNDFL